MYASNLGGRRETSPSAASPPTRASQLSPDATPHPLLDELLDELLFELLDAGELDLLSWLMRVLAVLVRRSAVADRYRRTLALICGSFLSLKVTGSDDSRKHFKTSRVVNRLTSVPLTLSKTSPASTSPLRAAGEFSSILYIICGKPASPSRENPNPRSSLRLRTTSLSSAIFSVQLH